MTGQESLRSTPPGSLNEARDALVAYAAQYECPGIEIEPGVTSGCSRAVTDDCPTCEALREALDGR